MNNHHYFKLLSSSLVLFLYTTSFAQDSAFQTKGFFINNDAGLITTAAAQPDGRIIVSGDFSFVEGSAATNIIRLSPDGVRDVSFSSTIGTNGTVQQILVQTDERIILGGVFSSYAQQPVTTSLVRINSDGTLDNGFIPYKPLYNYNGLTASVLQPDGKILLAGTGINTRNDATMGIIRLNSNGTIDNTFSMQGLLDALGVINTITVLHDGKIIVGGYFTSWNGTAYTGIVRLNSNGTIDPGFQLTGTGLHPYFAGSSVGVLSVKELPDYSLLVGGNFIYYNNTLSPGLVKLSSNGTIDNSFHMDPKFNVNSNFIVQCLAITSQNKIIVGGHFYIPDVLNQVYKDAFLLNADGSLDANAILSGPDNNRTFAAGGLSFIFPRPDGSFLGIGNYSGYYDSAFVNNISLYTPLLYRDPTFANSFLQKGLVNETIVQPDGKYLVNGNFNQYDTNYADPRTYIARLLPDGTLDHDFGNIGVNGPIFAMALQDDGKILGLGNFSSVGSLPKKALARFLADGSLDAGFDPGNGPNDPTTLYCLHIQNNQYIYVGGALSSFNNIPCKGIVRLLMDGSVDVSFNTVSSPVYAPSSIITTADGKVIAAESSDVTNRNYNTPLRLFRLLNDGSVDNGFQTPQLGWSMGKKVRQGSNNTIYWLGDLIQAGNPSHFKRTIIRLKQDGQLDSSAQILPDNYVISDFTVLPDSNLLVTGQILNGGLDSTFFVMHFKPDLSVDSSFNPVLLYYNIKNITVDNSDRVVVSGEPIRYLRIEKDQIQNIGVFKNSSMIVYDNTNNQKLSNVFGTVALSESANVGGNVEEEFVISNPSGAPVSLLDANEVLISGSNASEFHPSFTNGSATINQNDSLKFKLVFSPSSIGTKVVKVSIPYSNGLDNNYSFTVMATATNLTTPVTNIQNDNSIQIFPNPVVTDKLYIRSDLKFQTYLLIDQQGKIMKKGTVNYNGNTSDLSLGKQLASGLYILKLQGKTKDVVTKIYLQN